MKNLGWNVPGMVSLSSFEVLNYCEVLLKLSIKVFHLYSVLLQEHDDSESQINE